MFDERVEREYQEKQLIVTKLNALLSEYKMSEEDISARLGLYLDVLLDILKCCYDTSINHYREYFQKIERYLVGY